MVRVWLTAAIIGAVFTIYALVDCAMIDARRTRGLGKPGWIVIVVFLPVIGGILWFTIGRGPVPAGRALAPDDDAEFLRRLGGREAVDERIRQIEEELALLDDAEADGIGTPPGTSGGTRGPAEPPSRRPEQEGPREPGAGPGASGASGSAEPGDPGASQRGEG